MSFFLAIYMCFVRVVTEDLGYIEVLDGESFRLGVHSSKLQQGSGQIAIPVVQGLDCHADGTGERRGVVTEGRVLTDLVEHSRQALGGQVRILFPLKRLAERKQPRQLVWVSGIRSHQRKIVLIFNSVVIEPCLRLGLAISKCLTEAKWCLNASRFTGKNIR